VLAYLISCFLQDIASIRVVTRIKNFEKAYCLAAHLMYLIIKYVAQQPLIISSPNPTTELRKGELSLTV
jgi:hypothetical protein